jgi:hypothetical protein
VIAHKLARQAPRLIIGGGSSEERKGATFEAGASRSNVSDCLNKDTHHKSAPVRSDLCDGTWNLLNGHEKAIPG